MNEVLTEARDGVLLVTLNRPEARNAVDAAVAAGVASALDRLDEDDELRVGVITGAGRGFCAGADLKAKLRGESPRVPRRGFAGIVQYGSRKPLIAAVEGFAVAGGFEIALACDLIVAGRSTKFALPEVQRGLLATGGGLLRLAEIVPYHQAMRIILTGEPIGAERAHELGIVSDLVEDGAALDRALELAGTIRANAPLSIVASKQIVRAARDWPTEEAFMRQFEIADPLAESDDAREGAIAFAEKRAPRWSGR